MAALFALAVLGALLGQAGCTRKFYRQQADLGVQEILQEKDVYPKWAIQQFHVYPDPRARFADPTNPDRPPMPPDDPAAWALSPHPQRPGKPGIAVVGGTGYLELLALWDAENRQRKATADTRSFTTSPAKKEGETTENSSSKTETESSSPPYSRVEVGTGKDAENSHPFLVDLNQSVELGQFNSREYQSRREDVYLSALSVTLQRFAFVAQFFATEEAFREWTGRQAPEGRNNRWRPISTTGFTKLFSTGALLSLQWLNQTTISLTNAPLRRTVSESTLTLDLLQPMLQGGGRAVTLEPLTQAERDLLYEIRSYARFRKRFFVSIAGGDDANREDELAIAFSSLSLTPGTFAPTAGYLPSVLLLGQLDNQNHNVVKLRQFLDMFEAFKEGGDVSQLQVDQVEIQLLQGQSQVLQNRLNYRNNLDQFKLQLGVPTNLPLELDDAHLRPLWRQLRAFEAVIAQFEAARQESDAAGTPENVARTRATLRRIMEDSEIARDTRFRQQVPARWARWEKLDDKGVQATLERMSAERRRLLDHRADLEKQGKEFPEEERRRLAELDFEIDLGSFERSLRLYESQPWKKHVDAVRGQREQATQFRGVHHFFSQVLGEARNERIDRVRDEWPELPPVLVNGVDLLRVDLDEALAAAAQAALVNRFDLMNERGRLVDAWRQVRVFANALLGVFNVEYQANLFSPFGVAQPMNIGGSRFRHQLILNGELPLVRQLERNNYRAALISYQRQRRELMRVEDFILNQVRSEVRQLRVLAENYTIQKRSMELNYFQVENSLDTFSAPVSPNQAAGNSAANAAALTQQLLSAQARLPQNQNQLYDTWINYLINRMRLYRDMELMQFDARGVWIDEPTDGKNRAPDGVGRDSRPAAETGRHAEDLPQPRNLPAPAGSPAP